jgi:secondary thiamine-phosphate synthase enzyme
MLQQLSIALRPKAKGFHLVTSEVLKALPPLPEVGLLSLFIQHTSAALAINENADPTVRHDLELAFDQLAPEGQDFYQHTVEGADDMPAHIKSVLVGSSLTIPITQGKLNLGTWQGIYLCEFREAASARNLIVTIIS